MATSFADANASALGVRQDKSAAAMSPARWRRIEAYFGFGGFPTVDFDSWKKKKNIVFFFLINQANSGGCETTRNIRAPLVH